jgi:hypothetical protein
MLLIGTVVGFDHGQGRGKDSNRLAAEASAEDWKKKRPSSHLSSSSSSSSSSSGSGSSSSSLSLSSLLKPPPQRARDGRNQPQGPGPPALGWPVVTFRTKTRTRTNPQTGVREEVVEEETIVVQPVRYSVLFHSNYSAHDTWRQHRSETMGLYNTQYAVEPIVCV